VGLEKGEDLDIASADNRQLPAHRLHPRQLQPAANVRMVEISIHGFPFMFHVTVADVVGFGNTT
jgi:hypothetical protein